MPIIMYKKKFRKHFAFIIRNDKFEEKFMGEIIPCFEMFWIQFHGIFIQLIRVSIIGCGLPESVV